MLKYKNCENTRSEIDFCVLIIRKTNKQNSKFHERATHTFLLNAFFYSCTICIHTFMLVSASQPARHPARPCNDMAGVQRLAEGAGGISRCCDVDVVVSMLLLLLPHACYLSRLVRVYYCYRWTCLACAGQIWIFCVCMRAVVPTTL